MADETLNEGTSSSQSTGERSESTIKINVKTLESQIYTFLVNKDMSVPMLKEKVANAIGIPVEQQRLIFRGRVLKDDHLLSEYHLEDGHTLHLVARQPVPAQPATGAASENTGRSSGNQGNDSTGNAPRNRAGQVAQSVVLGTVNIADQGEGMITDISRLIGAVLHSLGAGILAPPVGGTGNTSPAAVAPGPETEGTQNASGRTQPGNPRPGLTVLNHPIQIPQISPAGTLPWQMVIPDSLTTLSDFISHMELVLQNSGSLSSATTNARAPPRSNDPSLNLRGLPTSEMLGSVVEQAQRLLSINASNALSQFAANLERGSASTDPSVRSQIQMEAMHVGVAMQHLGSMLLELGRTMMMLRMGQSPAESFVNAGPPVYISSTGPNPIMVQPFPQQTSSFLGVSSPPLVSGVSGTFGIGDPSRNINIHIHAGTPGAPGGSSVVTRASSEGQSVVQASQSGNSSGDSASVRGLPARTVIAAIPAHSSAETASHVLSVIYPVQVRSQASVSIPSASSQGSQLSTSGGAQPNAAILVPQPSPDSASVPAVVAQTNARVATVSGQGSSSPSLQSTDTRGSQPTVSSGAQPSLAGPFSQSSSETDTIARLVSQINTQIANALSSSVQGHNSSSFSVQHANTISPTQGPRPDQSGTSSENIGDRNESCQANNVSDTGVSNNSVSVESHVPDIVTREGEGKQLQQEGSDLPNIVGSSGSMIIQEPSTSSGTGGLTICQPSDTPLSKPVHKSSEKSSESTATFHASSSNQDGESGRPAPLGLGLGGLQPKRRTRPAKPTKKDGISRDTPSVNQNEHSIARGQQFLHSLVSQSPDTNSVNANVSSSPLSNVLGQMMRSIPLGGQAARQQVDAGNMMSHVLQSPAFSSLLTSVADQTGVGSPADLRNMLELCTQSPAIRNTLNDIVQQVDGQGEDLGGLLPGLGRGQGGIDFSRMIQQMMPVVSQALGRGSTHSTPVNDVQSAPQRQHNDGRTVGDGMLDSRNSQIDLHHARERIEQHDSAENVFRAMLESASNLFGGENNYEGLVEELGNNAEFSKEYMELLRRHICQRLETESKPES